MVCPSVWAGGVVASEYTYIEYLGSFLHNLFTLGCGERVCQKQVTRHYCHQLVFCCLPN